MCPGMVDIQDVRVRLSYTQHHPRNRYADSDSTAEDVSLLALDETLLWKRNHKVRIGNYRLDRRQMSNDQSI